MKQAFLIIVIHPIVLLYIEHTGDGRKMLGGDILLRFRGPTNA